MPDRNNHHNEDPENAERRQSSHHVVLDASIKEEDDENLTSSPPKSPRLKPIMSTGVPHEHPSHLQFDEGSDPDAHERQKDRLDSMGRNFRAADTHYPRPPPVTREIHLQKRRGSQAASDSESEGEMPYMINLGNAEKDQSVSYRTILPTNQPHDNQNHSNRFYSPRRNSAGPGMPVSFSIQSSPSGSLTSLDKSYVLPPLTNQKKKGAPVTMGCQVEEHELLARTIATQTSDEDLKKMNLRFKQEGGIGNGLRGPNASSSQLHGILRKVPSSKWGSTSTVAIDEHLAEQQAHDLANTSRTSSFQDLKNHGHIEGTNRRSRGGSIRAMFHLGQKDEKSISGSDSDELPTPGMSKHASFAKLPGMSPAKKVRGAAMPFWRRTFGKKDEIPRSFTMDDLKKDMTMNDHIIPKEELFSKLEVNPLVGLSDEEANHRLLRDGKNVLTPPKKTPEIIKFVREMYGGFSPILLVGAALSFLAYGLQWTDSDDVPGDNLYLAIVLLVVVFITGTFLYYQKAKSERIMEGFKKMLPQEATVFRNGQLKKISADDVVLGDVVEVSSGDRVPADIRIIESKSLKVDNSSLTGESEPQSRSPEGSENPLESKNLVFYTTNAVEGWGKGIVVKRGDGTVMGRIAKLTTRIVTMPTTIAREMNYFIKLIAILAIVMGVIFFIIPLAEGYKPLYSILLSIGLVVANVPEGVVITVTVMLTLTAQRMAKKNCLVKNLEAVETLGACSVICSDKTGTLTQNRMTVAHCWVDESIIATDTATEALAGANVPDTPAAKDLIRIATLCNRATWKEGQEDKPVYARECKGDASETALLKFTHLVTGDALAIRKANPAVAEIPFNSTNKFQASVHEIDLDGRKRYLVVMKGAPERIWDRSKTIVSHGQQFPIDEIFEKKFNGVYAELGGMGERVLGFSDLLLPEDKFPYPTVFNTENPNFPLEQLRFVGLISLIDPPRAAVPDAVAKCRSAGIQVIMVTGDHPVTAKAIARGVGIISEGTETVEDVAFRRGVPVKEVDPREAQAIVVHGSDLREMSDMDIDDVLFYHSEIVFARTSPQQKLIIVEACQRLGAVVAVTGDGVNDSPALKKANIGIAMGITGSDVSKQAADMVLLDDNFASIVTGVEEGRLIFDNLKKTICYTLMANIPEIAPVVLYFILNIPMGLTTIPMLLVCVGTDMVPSFSMAYESAEADIMKIQPRSPEERMVSTKLFHCSYLQAGIICAAGTFFAYFVTFGEVGFRPSLLFGLRDYFEDASIQDLQDSYGQEWTYGQRLYLSRVVQGSFFTAIVVFQWIDVISRRCRRVSVFQKPLVNWFMNLAICFETALLAICVYVPGLNYALNLYGIRFVWWLPMIPFAVYYLVYDEIRRYMIRRYPGGWMEREFYF